MNEVPQLELNDKEFQKILTLMNGIAKTMRHRHNSKYDTCQAYLLDIFVEDKEQIVSLFKLEDIGKLKNFLTDRLRKKLNIMRVTLKDPKLHSYKLSIVVEQKQSTSKYDILSIISDEIQKIFSIEYSKIRDIETESKKELLEIEFKGKPSQKYLADEDELYMDIEKYINKTGLVKVVSIDIQINKRARVSIDNFLTSIDFSDDIIEPECKKEVFYQHIKEFDLSENEENFINLTFKGFNVYNEEDVELFQSSIKNKNGIELVSKGYLRKNFFDRLCKKLTEKSPFI